MDSFRFIFQTSKAVQALLCAVKLLSSTLYLFIDSDGMRVNQVDGMHIVLLRARLSRADMAEGSHASGAEQVIAVDAKAMLGVLKLGGLRAPVSMSVRAGARTLSLQVGATAHELSPPEGVDRLPLMLQPEDNHECVLVMKAKAARQLIKDVCSRGNVLEIAVQGQGQLTVSCRHVHYADRATAPAAAEAPASAAPAAVEGRITVADGTPGVVSLVNAGGGCWTQAFDAQRFAELLKPDAGSPNLTLGFARDMPAVVRHAIAGSSFMELYIAPKDSAHTA